MDEAIRDASVAISLRPIFIGGCDRSGTTLLGAMLGAHPRHVAVPEMPFKVPLLESGSVRGNDALAMLSREWRFKIWTLTQIRSLNNFNLGPLRISSTRTHRARLFENSGEAGPRYLGRPHTV